MAHELYSKNDKTAMFYVGHPPWHGLGTKLDNPPTSEQAIKAAGLDWTVDKFPLFVRFGKDGKFFREVQRKALMPLDRIDKPECPVFGVVGQDYGIVQNKDAFAFFDPVVKEKQASYETAGALGEGERVWILAKIPGEILIKKEDKIDKYLLLANSHTGLAAVQIKITPVRVVCNNTLMMALASDDTVKIPHFPDVNKRLAFAGKFINNILKSYQELEQKFVAMADEELTETSFTAYLDKVMPVPQLDANASKSRIAMHERVISRREACRAFFEAGHKNDPPEIKHTLWSAYNTITYFSDHVMTLPDGFKLSELYEKEWDDTTKDLLAKRLRRLWFGDSASLKVRAYTAAVELMKAA